MSDQTIVQSTTQTTVAAPPQGSLQTFTLHDLAQFTREGEYAPDAPTNHHLFFVGRDDCHGIMTYLFSRVARSLYVNMFGYDDNSINDLIMKSVEDPTILAAITLDKSQAGGVHERKLLASDALADPLAYNSHFAVGQSLTHQITHSKGAVLDGVVGFEGSMNWSNSGEGTFVLNGKAGGPGYLAQNNTLMVFTDARTISDFTAELVQEHLVAVHQGGKLGASQ